MKDSSGPRGIERSLAAALSPTSGRRFVTFLAVTALIDAWTHSPKTSAGKPMETSRPLPGRRTGFSLLETLVVLSILGIVLAVALPSYSRYASTQRARAISHVLASDLRVAQQEAMTRRSAISVTFFAADPLCSGSAPSYVIGDPRAAVKRACLPADVTWDPVPSRPIAFQPTGAPGASATLSAASTRSGRRFRVGVAAGTGVVTEEER
jgi:prepilin-type N-terminal cleavage/methylation domain-containing protein